MNTQRWGGRGLFFVSLSLLSDLYSGEMDLLFIDWRTEIYNVKSLNFFLLSINLATIHSLCSHTVFSLAKTLIFNTPSWPNLCYVYASLKTPPKNPVGKKW
jgi:hypothetical protein